MIDLIRYQAMSFFQEGFKNVIKLSSENIFLSKHNEIEKNIYLFWFIFLKSYNVFFRKIKSGLC